jgi:2-keto-myo-inositol isomerase
MRFALNHIAAPRLPPGEFFRLARRLGIAEVEVRNDLPDVVGGVPPGEVRAAAAEAGVAVVAINALYPFNVWSEGLAARAAALADYAAASGARGLVMCPRNDGAPVAHAELVAALAALAPVLRGRGLVGFVEPLGFQGSSLRTKREAVAAIDAAGAADVCRLTHDTFHHRLAGETELFPERTGIVHISGVTDRAPEVAEMLDAHRVLVDDRDRLENVAQIRALAARGFDGPFSFEPFAPEVHALADPEAALRASMEHVAARAGGGT